MKQEIFSVVRLSIQAMASRLRGCREEETEEEYQRRIHWLIFYRPMPTHFSPIRVFEDTETHEEMLQRFTEIRSKEALFKFADELIDLRAEFMKSAQRGNADKLKAILDRGFPVNFKNPRTGLTALHLVAAYKARKALRVLLKTGQCDFLIRDWEGRLPSEIAFLYGKDPAVARLLGIKERMQAKRLGIKLTHRPTSPQ